MIRILLRVMRRNLRRRPLRTVLTGAGVASALLLFVGVESLSAGMDRALSGSDAARTLIVYRQHRYCPQTSFLPQRYADEIARVDGVASVLPVKVFLNNCRTSLDLVTFQGAPPDALLRARSVDLVEGDLESFRSRQDAALLGRAFAHRRGLGVGDRFRFGGITVDVAGVFESPEPVEEGVVLTHLDYLQRTAPGSRQGTVTQFEVKVDDPSRARDVAQAIDAKFKTAEEPTDTRAKVQFLEDATAELRELLRFGRLFGIVCVLVVLVLVGNTVLMAVNERRREFGVYLALGYRPPHLLAMVLLETLLLTVAGAAAGIAAAALWIRFSGLSIGVEGVTIELTASAAVIAQGVAVALAAGVLAGLAPAIAASRADVVESLRAA